MAVFSRKVGRIVAVRYPPGPANPKSSQLQPARITAVGAGTLVDVKILFKTGATYANLPRWSRSAPTTTGWVRT